MPAKSTSKAKKNQDIEFVNWELSKEEKLAAKSYDITDDKVFEALERLVDDGYRISWKRDDFNKCFNCSVTEPVETSGSSVRCIVSRGPTLKDACRIAAFKHYVLLDGDWGNITAERVERDVWG